MKEIIERYVAQSKHSLDNAGVYMRKGDAAKSGEFLWGSTAEAVKAVAASNGIIFHSHKRLKSYALELARELQDKSIADAFDKAEYLHFNFYESELGLEDVYRIAEDVRKAVGKILGLVPQF